MMPTASRSEKAALVAALVAAFALTTAFRFLATIGFANDHFVHLTGAQQILLGEWPTRDFVDAGAPLTYVASAAAQIVFGRTLFAEALLVALAFGIAASMTMMAVAELTGSLVLAVTAAILEVAIFPRSYGYPKVLLYSTAFVLFIRYAQRPTTARMVLIAATVVVAFLFRHDHGLYLGIGGVLVTLLSSGTESWRKSMGRAATFALVVLVLLLPYFIYVERHVGLWSYFRSGVEVSRAEAGQQGLTLSNLLDSVRWRHAVLIAVFHSIPLVALATVFARRHADSRTLTSVGVSLAFVSILVNFSFIRNPLSTRLPDAIVPAVVLGAWLIREAWRTSKLRPLWVPVSFVVIALTASSVLTVGNTVEQMDRAGLTKRLSRIGDRFEERTVELRARFSKRQLPSRVVEQLIPFFEYLDRCTTTEHRLFVAGFLPEVAFAAQRMFAGGQITFIQGYFDSIADQQLVVDRLRRQVAPFAIIARDEEADFNQGFQIVASFVRSRYAKLTDVYVDEATTIDVLLDRSVVANGTDPTTAWPCFKR